MLVILGRLFWAGYHIGAWRTSSSSSSLLISSSSLRSPERTTGLASVHDAENEPEYIPTTPAHTITWLTDESSSADITPTTHSQNTITFKAYDGEILRTAALRRNVASPHNGRSNLINCRGLGTCGTCAVEIVSGQVEPPTRNQKEQWRLNLPPHHLHNNTKLRLACQIQIKSDVQVLKRTGFWGQKQDVAPLSIPELYLGDLEYLLDNKSPDEPFEQ